jgi:transaldolase
VKSEFKIRLFADGADLNLIRSLRDNAMVAGFTTNPTLVRKAGVTDYRRFATELIELVPDRPLCLEVLSDDFDRMEQEALTLSALGKNVFVKIPITNCSGESSIPLIRRLREQRVRLNVTAVMTREQIFSSIEALRGGASSFLSIFAGRIADAGIDPIPVVREAVEAVHGDPTVQILWASPREVLNVLQAESIGCHAITLTAELLGKLRSVGRDLQEFSRETVQMFYHDAVAAGLSLDLDPPETATERPCALRPAIS